MSAPLAPTITVQLDAVDALAAELATLAAELADDVTLCRSAAAALYGALSGEEGWVAGSAATGWAALAEAVATRSAAVARTLASAVATYRATDAAAAAAIDPDRTAGGR